MTLLFSIKSPKINAYQYTLFYFLMAMLINISTVNAADNLKKIELSSLGGFETVFSAIEKVEFIKAQSLIGEVSYKSGENYSVTFPFNVQQVNYLVKNGNLINKGDTVAFVEGYEVHHFLDEYESAKALLEIQEQHFQTNKQYFENKTIKSSQWIEITKSYYEAKLNFEHIQHQMSFLAIDENEKISIVSPKSGIIKIPTMLGNKTAGDLAFEVISRESIKVKVTYPLLLSSNLSHFEVTPTCQLNINYVEKIANKFHQVLWATPSSSNCNLTLGQTIKVTPIHNIDGFQISMSAIFEFEDNNYIAVKDKATLSLIPINIIGTSRGNYIFTTKEDIEAKQGLISSVSILQGILLSLGAE